MDVRRKNRLQNVSSKFSHSPESFDHRREDHRVAFAQDLLRPRPDVLEEDQTLGQLAVRIAQDPDRS